jgi:hypothetical protein
MELFQHRRNAPTVSFLSQTVVWWFRCCVSRLTRTYCPFAFVLLSSDYLSIDSPSTSRPSESGTESQPLGSPRVRVSRESEIWIRFIAFSDRFICTSCFGNCEELLYGQSHLNLGLHFCVAKLSHYRFRVVCSRSLVFVSVLSELEMLGIKCSRRSPVHASPVLTFC